ncbi:MAG TPA: threonine synthase [Thermodesulfobacteriota bacterium]
MTTATCLACVRCGRTHSLGERYRCPACGGILDVRYDMEAARRAGAAREVTAEAAGMWGVRTLLPVAANVAPVSLGEGATPLVRAPRLAARLGVGELLLKLESANPTGSFKDRPVSVALTKARELGVGGVVTASSGNAGAAVSAYAARAGLPAVVLVPEGLVKAKLAQIAMYGATLVAVRGHFSAAYALAAELARHTGWYNVTTTCLSAFPTEGNKTVAYELLRQCGGTVPDWVMVPVGSGPLLVGTLKGFEELRALGLADRVPRMVAVQAEGCAPVARAFAAGADEVEAWGTPDTVASGIRDPLQGYADDGTLTLAAARRSGGAAVAVSDARILEATRDLARDEGVLAEPTGAAGVAGIAELRRRGAIGEGARVVALVTGHGLKDPAVLATLVPEPPVVEPRLDALLAVTDG